MTGTTRSDTTRREGAPGAGAAGAPGSEPDEDAGLMLAFARGEAAAFDRLFERWAAKLLRFLERMVHDTATAEELVQETFLRVYRARDRYEPSARFSTWLFHIATNLALNELRRPRRSRAHTSTDGAPSGPAELGDVGAARTDDVVHARRESARVERALETLPERQRAALWLAAVEGLAYAEIAESLGTTTRSVKSLVHRARTALVRALDARDASCEREGEEGDD
ncbi:MAG: sigma-70 family RNA polymerase sigma factor [Myxococcota bacterium]